MKIGFARVDVTPPLGTKITGSWQLRYADGVLDPLELCAVVLETDGERMAVITADFLTMSEPAATIIRAKISASCGIPAERIFMQCLHQHTATSGATAWATGEDYVVFLKQRYCDVTSLAISDLAEATMGYGERRTPEPLSFIRRFRMKDGSVATNPGTMNPDIDHPLGEADNTVRLVRFFRQGAKDIALVGFQTHPDTVGGTKFTADWPGFVRRIFEKRQEDTHCILMNGCQGDTNHYKVGRPVISRAKNAECYAFAENMGRIIAETAMSLWDETSPLTEGPVSGAFHLQPIRTSLRGIERIEECKAIFKAIAEGDEEAKKIPMSDKGEIRRIAGLEGQPLFQKVPVSMVALGRLAFVGFGGEPFTEYATVLRKAYPQFFIFTACNCNGGQGYLPSASAFEEGGYEARTSNFSPDTPYILQGVAKELLAAHEKKL